MNTRLVKKAAAIALCAALLASPYIGGVQTELPRMGLTLSIFDGWDRDADTETDEEYFDRASGRSVFNFGDLEDSPAFGDSSDNATRATSGVYAYTSVRKSITEYAAINKDVKAWLIVPGTNINRPVTFSSQDNNYYVYRDWRGTNYPGTTYQNYTDTASYLDYRTTFGNTWESTSKNLVVYGHNWNNQRSPFVIGDKAGYTMFAQLPSYTSQEFAKNNPHIYFSTGENEGIWRVFAAGYCELSPSFFYNQPNPTTADFQTIIDEWKSRSLFNFGVDVNTKDRILTLSTCTRAYSNAGGTQRYVVVARLLRPGESETDAITVSVNQNVKQPSFNVSAATQAAS